MMSSRSQFKLIGEFVVGSDVADVVDSEDVIVVDSEDVEASEAVVVDNSGDVTVVDSAAVEAVVGTVKKGLSVIGAVEVELLAVVAEVLGSVVDSLAVVEFGSDVVVLVDALGSGVAVEPSGVVVDSFGSTLEAADVFGSVGG
jgi:hypothetical protein